MDSQVSHGSISQKPSQKGTESRLGLRRATGSAALVWLLKGVSPKPKSNARKRDVEEATQGERQQRCSPSQVEAGWSRSFHQSDRSFRRPSRSSQGASHLCQDLVGCPAIGFGLILESIMPLGGGSRPGLACCPQVIGRGEEAGEGDSSLSGGAAVWYADQDESRG